MQETSPGSDLVESSTDVDARAMQPRLRGAVEQVRRSFMECTGVAGALH